MDLGTLLDPLALVTLLLLLIFFPWLGSWEFRRLGRWNAEGIPDARMRHYNWIAWWEWISVAGLTLFWFVTGRSATTLGLIADPSGWQWLGLAAGLFASAFLVYQMIGAVRDDASLAKVRTELGNLERMIPRTASESRAFSWLSVTAGICEEILYRGILLALLSSAFGTWPAVLLSSLVFGLGHAYQGSRGIVKTGLIGLVLAVITVLTGSLYAAIVLHAVLDLTSGRIMRAALSAPAGGRQTASAGTEPEGETRRRRRLGRAGNRDSAGDTRPDSDRLVRSSSR